MRSLAVGLLLVAGCSNAYQRPIATLPPGAATTTETTSATRSIEKTSPPNAPLTASAQPEGRGRYPDRRLSDEVRTALMNDEALKKVALDRVRIVSAKGKVEVTGIVPTDEDSAAIGKRIATVKGVTSVDNQLDTLELSR